MFITLPINHIQLRLSVCVCVCKHKLECVGHKKLLFITFRSLLPKRKEKKFFNVAYVDLYRGMLSHNVGLSENKYAIK